MRYWLNTVFQPEYTWKGESRRVTEWAARMQHLGRRELMPLGTANKTAAAKRAKEIYLFLQSNGWEPTLKEFKPDQLKNNQTACTVGEFLAEVKAKAGGRAKTVADYCRSFRTIVAGICGIDGGREKFDYCNGGHQRWLAQVEAVRLSETGRGGSGGQGDAAPFEQTLASRRTRVAWRCPWQSPCLCPADAHPWRCPHCWTRRGCPGIRAPLSRDTPRPLPVRAIR